MASTYVDNYTIVDTVNTQSNQATQYNSNQGQLGTTLTKDSYKPTSTSSHTIPSALQDIPAGAILDHGYAQKALYELLLMIVVNWNNAMRSLDDSGGVAKSDYESVAAISDGTTGDGSLGGDYSDACIAALLALGLSNSTGTGSLGRKINISEKGIGTPELAIMCQAIASCINLATTNLDADATLSDADYGDDTDIIFSAKTGHVPPLDATAITGDAFNIFHAEANGSANPCSRITTNGIEHGALVDFLNTVVTNMNALWVKLDADI